MIELLREIHNNNVCDKCGGSGINCPAEKPYGFGSCTLENTVHCDNDCGKAVPCPSCTGGFIVPELERTEKVYGNVGTGNDDDWREAPRMDCLKFAAVDIIPSPTLPEVLDMLPEKIGSPGYRLNITKFEGRYYATYKVGAYHMKDAHFKDPDPLIAALKLLLWVIKQRKEGKV